MTGERQGVTRGEGLGAARWGKLEDSSCWHGKRVRIRFKDGVVLITRFREKKGKKIVTDAGTFPIAELKAFSIYKFKSAPNRPYY